MWGKRLRFTKGLPRRELRFDWFEGLEGHTLTTYTFDLSLCLCQILSTTAHVIILELIFGDLQGYPRASVQGLQVACWNTLGAYWEISSRPCTLFSCQNRNWQSATAISKGNLQRQLGTTTGTGCCSNHQASSNGIQQRLRATIGQPPARQRETTTTTAINNGKPHRQPVSSN